MAGKRLELHPAALSELKAAVEWYMERSEPAAQEFVAEVDTPGVLEGTALRRACRRSGRRKIWTLTS